MKISRQYEDLSPEEKASVFGVICKWEGTKLTHSIYVLGVSNAAEAQKDALEYFNSMKKGILFKEIASITVLPKGKSVHDKIDF